MKPAALHRTQSLPCRVGARITCWVALLVLGSCKGEHANPAADAGCRPPTFTNGCYYSACVKGWVCEEPTEGGPGPGACGNNVMDAGEQCDGKDVGTATCDSISEGQMPGGKLGCTAYCTYDLSTCGATVTGDGNRLCGGSTCQGIPLSGIGIAWAACCPDGDAVASCGVNLGVLEGNGVPITPECQPRAQPGRRDSTCPDAVIDSYAPRFPLGPVVTFSLPGCCRVDGTCGRLMDSLAFTSAFALTLDLGLGCVAASAFSDAGPPQRCSPSGARDASADATSD